MKIEINIKQKELNEYLGTEESSKDFLYCVANDIEWNSFLREKGLIKKTNTNL